MFQSIAIDNRNFPVTVMAHALKSHAHNNMRTSTHDIQACVMCICTHIVMCIIEMGKKDIFLNVITDSAEEEYIFIHL